MGTRVALPFLRAGVHNSSRPKILVEIYEHLNISKKMVENVVFNAFPFLENGTLRNGNADSPSPHFRIDLTHNTSQNGCDTLLENYYFRLYK